MNELDAAQLGEKLGVAGAGVDEPVYLTCQSGGRALQAAERLREAGLRNLVLIEGGTEAWERSGLPLRRCGGALPLESQVQIAVGTLLVLKVIVGFTVHELFFAAVAFIGAGLILAGATRWCALARLLAMMPWNRGRDCRDEAPA
jgi:hypothetical protein